MAKKFIKPADDYTPDAPAEVLARSIDEFNLYDETKDKLRSVDLLTIGDIARCEMRQLYRIERMNKRDVFAVLRALKSVKLDFRQLPKPESTAESEADSPQNKGKKKARKPQPENAGTQRAGAGGKGDIKAVPKAIERERVNTRDFDERGNRKRSSAQDYDRRDRDRKQPVVVNLPPLKSPDGLYKFYRAGKWGYKNENGEVAIEPRYDEAYNFSEGLAGVEIGEKVGFINTEGLMVIPPIYDCVTSFSEGLASATIDGRCGYIDKDGNEVFAFEYEAATAFTNDIALVKKDGKWGYMDRHTGEIRLR